MKKLIFSILIIFLCLTSFTLVSCGGEDDTTTTKEDDTTTTVDDSAADNVDLCEHKSTEVIPGKEPSTTSTGRTEGEKCVLCGKILNTQQIISAKPFIDGFEYRLNDDNSSYSVIGIGSVSDTEIVIPTVYNGLPVTEIGEEAFKNCKNIKLNEI